MASPHTAGTVALLWAVRPSYKENIPATRQLPQNTSVGLTTGETCGGSWPVRARITLSATARHCNRHWKVPVLRHGVQQFRGINPFKRTLKALTNNVRYADATRTDVHLNADRFGR
jgi:hypothetical protein